MRMLPLILTFVSILCMVQTGCTDNSYQGLYSIGETDEVVEPQKVLMFVGKSNEVEEVTRGTGAIEGADGLESRHFYIYSFLKGDDEVLYTETSVQNPTGCLADASIDDPGSVQGRKAYWDSESGIVEWNALETPALYYPDGDALELNYDFFAYYVDDMVFEESDFQRGKNYVTVDVEIDGSQDLMSSYAKPDDEELRNGLEDSDPEYAGKEYAYRKECSFSWYTARMNIHPTFVFRHHLVKLDFKLVPGSTPGLTKDVQVEKVEVCSKSKGKFTVAHKNPDNMGIEWSGDPVSLELKEKDGSPFMTRLVSTVQPEDNVEDGTIDDLGSLLVAPDMDYKLYVTLSETRDGEPVKVGERNELHIYLGKTPGLDEGDEEREDGGRFEAGGEYLITLTIYGKMDIRASVDLTKWNEGGDYIYDFDEEYWEDND